MAARTNAARLAALESDISRMTAALEALVAAQAPTPTARPRKGAAKSPSSFVTYLRDRAAAQTGVVPEGFEACGIHDEAECNRAFRVGSKGQTQHVARIDGVAS